MAPPPPPPHTHKHTHITSQEWPRTPTHPIILHVVVLPVFVSTGQAGDACVSQVGTKGRPQLCGASAADLSVTRYSRQQRSSHSSTRRNPLGES